MVLLRLIPPPSDPEGGHLADICGMQSVGFDQVSVRGTSQHGKSHTHGGTGTGTSTLLASPMAHPHTGWYARGGSPAASIVQVLSSGPRLVVIGSSGRPSGSGSCPVN